MRKLNVKNIAKDKFDSDGGSNVIQIDYLDTTINSPTVAPHQSEVKKANLAGIKLKSKLIQYIHRVETRSKITDETVKSRIIESIKNTINENPDSILDIYFQFWKDIFPTAFERKSMLEIQDKSECLIISDCETDPNQAVEAFELQLQNLITQFPSKIISPTLDMIINSPEKFAKKLDILFKYGIQRFNIIYRNIFDTQDNWITLSQKLYGENIWCNVVGVPNQYYSQKNPYSLISSVFIYGVHSASLQYPRFSKKKKSSTETPTPRTIFTFNSKTGLFEATTMTDDEARAHSINELLEYANKIRQKIMSEKFYSEFIPSQPALYGILHSRI